MIWSCATAVILTVSLFYTGSAQFQRSLGGRLYIMLLSDKYKLSGKDLFSAIESDLDELEKLRDGSVSEKDSDSSSSEKGGMIKGASADTARHSFPHTFTEGHEAEQKKGDNI